MSDLLNSGIIFFNSGRFYDAHEVWEDLWRMSEGPVRRLHQGLVQAAVGCHHLRNANRIGAVAQLQKCLAKLDEFPADAAGLDLDRLRRELRQVLQIVVAQPDFHDIEVPGIHRLK